jgi:hypothetical protein
VYEAIRLLFLQTYLSFEFQMSMLEPFLRRRVTTPALWKNMYNSTDTLYSVFLE